MISAIASLILGASGAFFLLGAARIITRKGACLADAKGVALTLTLSIICVLGAIALRS